jgi:hypothetical protein
MVDPLVGICGAVAGKRVHRVVVVDGDASRGTLEFHVVHSPVPGSATGEWTIIGGSFKVTF